MCGLTQDTNTVRYNTFPRCLPLSYCMFWFARSEGSEIPKIRVAGCSECCPGLRCWSGWTPAHFAPVQPLLWTRGNHQTLKSHSSLQTVAVTALPGVAAPDPRFGAAFFRVGCAPGSPRGVLGGVPAGAFAAPPGGAAGAPGRPVPGHESAGSPSIRSTLGAFSGRDGLFGRNKRIILT